MTDTGKAGDSYTCSECEGTFERVYSDEEAMAAAKSRHPDVPEDEMAVVCDACFKRAMRTIN